MVGKFLGTFPEIPEIVEFLKSEPFNWEFREFEITAEFSILPVHGLQWACNKQYEGQIVND